MTVAASSQLFTVSKWPPDLESFVIASHVCRVPFFSEMKALIVSIPALFISQSGHRLSRGGGGGIYRSKQFTVAPQVKYEK